MARKSGRKRFRFWTFLATCVSFLSVSVVALGLYLHQTIYENPLHVEPPGYVLNVPAGMQVQKMADLLNKDGVLEHPELFVLWVRLTDVRTKLKAGEYLIKPGMTPQALINLLISGKVIQHSLTLVEGWNFDSVMNAVNQAPKLMHTLTGLSPEEIMIKIGHPNEHPEGRFFPDTYCFPAGTTDVAFLQRAYNRLQKKLSNAWESRISFIFIKTPYEALILASIIEKESDHTDEYMDISGVYHRRIQRNMPLQADPTVIYGAGKMYNGKITLDLLKSPSAYNTYLNLGLPPTPIAMPSEKALFAATHPKPGDSIYFVAKGDGKGHVFTKTLDDHQVAVNRYRAVIKKQEVRAAMDKSLSVQNSENNENVVNEKAINGNATNEKSNSGSTTNGNATNAMISSFLTFSAFKCWSLNSTCFILVNGNLKSYPLLLPALGVGLGFWTSMFVLNPSLNPSSNSSPNSNAGANQF